MYDNRFRLNFTCHTVFVKNHIYYYVYRHSSKRNFLCSSRTQSSTRTDRIPKATTGLLQTFMCINYYHVSYYRLAVLLIDKWLSLFTSVDLLHFVCLFILLLYNVSLGHEGQRYLCTCLLWVFSKLFVFSLHMVLRLNIVL